MAVDRRFQNVALRKDAPAAINSNGDPHPLEVDSQGVLYVHQGDLAATKDSIGIAIDGSQLMNGNSSLTINSTFASLSSNTVTTLVSSATTRVRLVQAVVTSNAAGAASLTFGEGSTAASTAISHAIALPITQTLAIPFSPVGWFQTSSGKPLNVTVTAAGAAAITFWWVNV